MSARKHTGLRPSSAIIFLEKTRHKILQGLCQLGRRAQVIDLREAVVPPSILAPASVRVILHRADVPGRFQLQAHVERNQATLTHAPMVLVKHSLAASAKPLI